jgi:hypothetical protein
MRGPLEENSLIAQSSLNHSLGSYRPLVVGMNFMVEHFTSISTPQYPSLDCLNISLWVFFGKHGSI